MNPLNRVLLLAAIAVVGCEQRPKFKPAPPPTPPLGPPAQRISSGERLNSEDAMTFSDLSLLLRTNTPEHEIMLHLAQRGVLDPITATQVQSLAAMGASPNLLIVLQDPQYVLSAPERQAYVSRKQRRDAAVRGKSNADQKQREAEFTERQRQLELQQQTYEMVAQKEREQKQREQAKLEYEQRRKALEADIENLKLRITDYRRYGYRESELVGMNQRLKAMQDELFNLKVR